MLIVGLTGNVAAGKSSVAKLFAEWGAFVTDADAIVRELQRPGTPVFDAIVERFGPGVVDPGGDLDRDALRRIVLRDPRSLAALNAIVHPAVAEQRGALEQAAREAGARIVVHDVPLLFEATDPASYDLVVLVDAPEAVRRHRLRERRGLAEAEADRMMAAQLPSGPKRDASDIVIDNDGDRTRLASRARAAWSAILERAAGA